MNKRGFVWWEQLEFQTKCPPPKEGVSRDTHPVKSTLDRVASKEPLRAQYTTPADEGLGDNSSDPCPRNPEDKRDALINYFDVGAKER